VTKTKGSTHAGVSNEYRNNKTLADEESARDGDATRIGVHECESAYGTCMHVLVQVLREEV
jgi:hypothetical protein